MNEIIIRQTDKIINLCKQAQKQKFPTPHIISIKNILNYSLDDFEKDFKNIPDNNAIYIIASDKLHFDKSVIKKLFTDKKSEYDKHYHVSKINDGHNWDKRNESFILYVGSKEKGLKRRLREHLSLLNSTGRSTYSLYLKDWWLLETKIVITTWCFGDDIKPDMLQILEDSIWDEYQPIFGKKGATFNKKTVPTK